MIESLKVKANKQIIRNSENQRKTINKKTKQSRNEKKTKIQIEPIL